MMKRLAGLWLSFYLGIYCIPFPLGLIPRTAPIIEFYFKMKIEFAAWVGLRILGFKEIPLGPTGSSDTLANYILTGILVVFAFFVALAWKTFFQTQKDRSLYVGIYNYVRIVLASLLLFYGWGKIFLPGQFGALTPGRLLQSFGDSSPMSLLWTFMAASKPYTIFAGILEVLSGTLLLIPSLVGLGSLLSIGVLANVFMLNLCYDVPVKIFSFHLLLFSIFLAIPDLKRFGRFFILNLPVEPKRSLHFFKTPRKSLLILEIIFAFGISLSAIWSGVKGARYYQKSLNEVKFFGAWNVVDFSEDSKGQPPQPRWAQVAFDLDDKLYIRTSQGGWLRFKIEIDDSKNKIGLSDPEDVTTSAQLIYTQTAPEELLISGQINSTDVSIRLKKDTRFKAPLQERGFHWITEIPYER